jgi:protein-tyrosine-phosphatase
MISIPLCVGGQVTTADFQLPGLVLAMDASNLHDLQQLRPSNASAGWICSCVVIRWRWMEGA